MLCYHFDNCFMHATVFKLDISNYLKINTINLETFLFKNKEPILIRAKTVARFWLLFLKNFSLEFDCAHNSNVYY